MSGRGFHESSLIVKRFISDEYQQMQGSVALNSLLPNGFKTSIFVTKGEPVKDNLSLNYSLGFTIKSLIKNKPLKVSLKQSFYDGGGFLGVTREDTSKQISVSYPVYKRFAVSIGYEINDSTVNSFSHTGPLVSFSLPTFNF